MYNEGKRLAIVQALFTGGIGFAMGLCSCVVIFYASQLYEDDEITVGNITSFLLYMLQMIFNFMILSFVFGNVFKLSGASKKLVEYMRYVPSIISFGGKMPRVPAEDGEIELKNVTFSYPSKPEVNVCDDISIKVEKNKVVALVGQSGCGKSSVISLIERFYVP